METIREEVEDTKWNDGAGSDTGYFSNENEFNNRDEKYDSQKEEEFKKRSQQLYGDGDDDDEDHRPYDDFDDDGAFFNKDSEIRRQKEFGESE